MPVRVFLAHAVVKQLGSISVAILRVVDLVLAVASSGACQSCAFGNPGVVELFYVLVQFNDHVSPFLRVAPEVTVKFFEDFLLLVGAQSGLGH